MESIKYNTYKQSESVPDDQIISAAELYCRIWKEEPWNEDWTVDRATKKLLNILSHDDSLLILGISDNKVRGFVSGKSISLKNLDKRTKKSLKDVIDSNDIYSIAEIGVDSSCRGQGLGKKLLGGLIDQVITKNKDAKFVSHTDTKAESAKRLYENLGFRDTNILDSSLPTHTYWVR